MQCILYDFLNSFFVQWSSKSESYSGEFFAFWEVYAGGNLSKGKSAWILTNNNALSIWLWLFTFVILLSTLYGNKWSFPNPDNRITVLRGTIYYDSDFNTWSKRFYAWSGYGGNASQFRTTELWESTFKKKRFSVLLNLHYDHVLVIRKTLKRLKVKLKTIFLCPL